MFAMLGITFNANVKRNDRKHGLLHKYFEIIVVIEKCCFSTFVTILESGLIFVLLSKKNRAQNDKKNDNQLKNYNRTQDNRILYWVVWCLDYKGCINK